LDWRSFEAETVFGVWQVLTGLLAEERCRPEGGRGKGKKKGDRGRKNRANRWMQGSSNQLACLQGVSLDLKLGEKGARSARAAASGESLFAPPPLKGNNDLDLDTLDSSASLNSTT